MSVLPRRRARLRQWLREPVSPRTNLVLASTSLCVAAAFLAGLAVWLLSNCSAGTVILAEVVLFVALGAIAGSLYAAHR